MKPVMLLRMHSARKRFAPDSPGRLRRCRETLSSNVQARSSAWTGSWLTVFPTLDPEASFTLANKVSIWNDNSIATGSRVEKPTE